MAVRQETETDLRIESDPATGGQYNGTRIRLSQDMTRLKEKDYRLLKKENTIVLGESGGPYAPTFGNHINDFVKFHVYSMNDEYIKSGISENFENSDGDIKLDPGTDLRKAGFTRGNYKIKYYFYRRMAGSDDVVLTKNVGNDSGIVHSGNPQLTGLPMGAFYVDDGKVFQGDGPPGDGSPPSELDVKEYKFFIDEISSNRKEVRLAPQLINLNKYKQEFNSLSNMYEVYVPLSGSGYGSGKFNGEGSTAFQFEFKADSDIGFEEKYRNGFLEVENAFIVGYEDTTDTLENEAWSLEDPIPESYIEAYDLKDVGTGYPMAVRYVVKEESNQKTLGGHDFDEYAPIPDLTTPGIRYHFDFGCGHTEITDTPFANHTYDTVGSYNPTVTIMTPNFTDVITDVYSNRNAPQDGPGLRGSKLKSFIPTPEEDPLPPPSPDLEYMPNGTIVRYWQTYWIIDGGKKRFIVSYGHDTPENIDDYLPVNINGVYDTNAEAALYNLMIQKGADGTPWSEWHGNGETARNNRQDFSLPLNWAQQNAIPNGAPFTTLDFAATGSTAGGTPRQWVLPDLFPIEGNETPGGDPFVLNVSINAVIDGQPVSLPYTGDEDEPELFVYWKINDFGTDLSEYTGTHVNNEEVNIEVVVFSPGDAYTHLTTEWGDGFHATHRPDSRTVVMSGNTDLTATIGIAGEDEADATDCFIAGTQITMSDGSMKNIEDIEVGDIVKSWNEEISQIENGTVIKLMSPIHDDIVKLTFGDVVNGNTFDHPYYVKGKGWCSYKPEWTMERYDIGQIGQLEVGDVCYYNNDSELEEIKLSHIKEELGEVQTYIFKVENNTFFANNILTHNK